jgi:hypothetical protein
LVAKDELGKFFLDDLKRNGVVTNLTHENCPEGITGKCLVMTSPDAERTMNTFLGVSSFLSPEHLDEEAIKNSTYVYLEGYLVASPKGLEAIKEAKRIAQQNGVLVALTFSDASMVKYFSKQMEEIVGTGVDLLFCNEEEAMIFSGTNSLSEAREKLKGLAKKFVITLGANGALVFDGGPYRYGGTHMAFFYNFSGGGVGDGRERYKGNRTSAPPIAFVMQAGIERWEAGELQASMYEHVSTNKDGDDVIWNMKFAHNCAETDAIALVNEKVSPNPDEW